jgi:hypothetical protein
MTPNIVVLLTVLVIAGAVAGYYYGILTGRIVDWACYTIVVASIGASVGLTTGFGAVTFVAVVSIIAAAIGQSATYRIRPAIPPALITGAAVLAVLWDVAYFGAWLIVG